MIVNGTYRSFALFSVLLFLQLFDSIDTSPHQLSSLQPATFVTLARNLSRDS